MANDHNHDQQLDQRKKDHLDLAQKSQTSVNSVDTRFDYEPLFFAHPDDSTPDLSVDIFGKTLKAPLWISSMTGGTGEARHINQNLGKACGEFGLGMGLGSCRSLLTDDKYFEDFNLRPLIGENGLLYANLGIAQLEELATNNNLEKVNELIKKLRADGLIIHINIMQEWFQPEGDRLLHPPLETINRVLEAVKFPIIVKEVGQGLGPKSLEALMKLPLVGIDFAAFGGTNFSKLEAFRSDDPIANSHRELITVGQTAEQMVADCNKLLESLGNQALCKHFIISGGVASFLQGHYLMNSLHAKSLYGQAKPILEQATGNYESLRKYIFSQLKGLEMANRFLNVRSK
jgi:isopentenyl-diphosphate delta-isomerase